VKVIAITDNILPHEKRPGDRILTKYFLKCCDAFIVMSGTVRDELLSFVESPKFKLVHHPVYDIFGSLVDKQTGRAKMNLDQNGRYILFFGFIRKYKGLDLLLQAMTDERLRKLNVKLLVAGEFYENKKKYIDLIDSNNLAARVTLFDHYIPTEEVKYYFASADLVTQPYRSASQSGITQLAYHFERPVLVTNVGGLAEVIEEDNSGYVTSTDPADIASRIADYFESNKELALTESIKAHKKKFSWTTMIDGIKSLYAATKI
jgi:glycosyltransferase involved in cell wall biosynthesis